jgi:MtfA peptidase
VFGLLRNRRRRRILAHKAISNDVWRATLASLPALAWLDEPALARLRDLAVLFVEEKQIVGAGGLDLDEAMRVRIGVLACQLVLELGFDWYDAVVTIIVYPDEFVVRDREVVDDDGVVHIGDDVLSGEAWEQGPVVLAWADVEASGQGDGYNVVAHEFAHKLDLLGGAMDGMPPLHRGMSAAQWSRAFQAAYDELRLALDHGAETWLDPYAAESPAEFFAVCTELFFDTPNELAMGYPAVFTELCAFFRQSPRHGAAH